MAARKRGLGAMLGDLAGALPPLSARDLSAELADRLRKVPTRLNEFGFDDYGLELAVGAARGAARARCSTATTSASRPTASSACRRAACC